MNTRCPSCQLVFDREPGYFLGAMMISYAIALVFYIPVFWILRRLTRQALWAVILEMLLLFVPFVPFVFRYSRILWIYLDQTIDPEK